MILSSEYIPSVILFIFLVKMDFSIISNWPLNQSPDNRLKLALLFVHLVIVFAILSPIISRLLSQFGDEKLKKFIGLPEVGKNITYIDFYDFLSGLALSAFYLTILLFSLKEVYEKTGWVIAGIYAFLMFVSSISIAVLSLVRYIWLFTKFNNYAYYSVALLASSMCMAVIGVAMNMVS